MKLCSMVVLTSAAIALTACDATVSLDHVENTTILAADAIVLSHIPVRLSSDSNANAVGGETSVCVVLEKDVLDGDTEDRQAIYDSILGGAEIFGMLHTVDGATIKLVNGKYSWSHEGELVARGELASCLRPHPNGKLPTGTEIDWVELGALAEVRALGVFVYSTNKWDF